jgi:hypothetical protein
MGRKKNYFALDKNYYTIQHRRKQKLKYQTQIPIYELPNATKLSSVFELCHG